MDEDILAEKQVTVRPICEKPMTALVGDGNQSNQHQTEIPSEPEKSHSFVSFPSFGEEPRPPFDVFSILRLGLKRTT